MIIYKYSYLNPLTKLKRLPYIKDKKWNKIEDKIIISKEDTFLYELTKAKSEVGDTVIIKDRVIELYLSDVNYIIIFDKVEDAVKYWNKKIKCDRNKLKYSGYNTNLPLPIDYVGFINSDDLTLGHVKYYGGRVKVQIIDYYRENPLDYNGDSKIITDKVKVKILGELKSRLFGDYEYKSVNYLCIPINILK